jgi:peptidoglycan/LPS O-acetylase OafA/YrhL
VGRFYARRVRRLLPAATVAIVVTAAVFWAVAGAVRAGQVTGSAQAASLYVANWHFIGTATDYFGADVATNPFVHFWSLSIEEQFYLAWPLLLTLLWRRTGMARGESGRGLRRLRVIIGGAAVASLVWALVVAGGDLNRAYYGTDTRAYQLLAGALLALSPGALSWLAARTARVSIAGVVATGAIVLVAGSVVDTTPVRRGVLVVLPAVALIAAIESHRRGPVHGVFAHPLVAYLGRCSYATYLWHWPIIVLVRERFQPGSAQLFLVSALLATAIASLSLQVLERPIREAPRLNRHGRVVIAIGVAISLVSGFFVVPRVMQHSKPSAASASLDPGALDPESWLVGVPQAALDEIGRHRVNAMPCRQSNPQQCILVEGTGPRILLVGDSHAFHLINAFREVAREHDASLGAAIMYNCTWQRGVVPAVLGAPANLRQMCLARQAEWYDHVIPALDPDIVVLAQRPLDDPAQLFSINTTDGRLLEVGTKGYRDALTQASRSTVDALRRDGRKVVLIEPIPIAPRALEPLVCLEKQSHQQDCRYVTRAQSSASEVTYRAIAESEGVWALDIDRLVCPYLPICDPIVGGVVVKIDRGHLTPLYSTRIGAPIDEALVALGVFDRG